MPVFHGFIPARFASTRFPGKPLAMIHGRPMFAHVYDRALASGVLHAVHLCTDDERIWAKALELDIPVVMTGADHASGTDRILEAADRVGIPDSAVVINIQGDEPAIPPAMIREVAELFCSEEVRVGTLARAVGREEASDPDVVKVVLSADGRALYFSRSMIPFFRSGEDERFLAHVGLYAFRMEALRTFGVLGRGLLERIECLEQLRLLEAGIPIHVALTEHRSRGVDKPSDIDFITCTLGEEL
ncbi:MAG: 3-deoxy-manno-octulosonate cytidylyltransferase [Deltaproteobacteria bacterium]|nr:3-deoxy-manno-octulosonate cytidylyltransferase [Deltaproteobacteria bacterium]